MSNEKPFELLVDILQPYADDMTVKHNTETNYYLEETQSSSKPQMFGAVQVKKSYTSFHLFPVYTNPDLLTDISDDLRKRMQGKSCFNFKAKEQVPVDELEALVRAARESLPS
ncbi:MAG: hypothetical protein AAFR21_05300 [Pseudomonadota bacterium]